MHTYVYFSTWERPMSSSGLQQAAVVDDRNNLGPEKNTLKILYVLITK